MAANNLRIVYQNLADIPTSVISASNELSGITTPVGNLLKDPKSSIWRTAAATTTAEIAINYTSPGISIVGGTKLAVVFSNTNFISTSTIRLRLFTAVTSVTNGVVTGTGGTGALDSGALTATPYQTSGFSEWYNDPLAVLSENASEYKNRKVYSRIYFTLASTTTVKAIQISISNPAASPVNYVEASRLIFGPCWSPTYNTGYGLSASTTDLSESIRTDAGDLITNVKPKTAGLSFDLQYLTNADRAVFNKISKLNGSSKAMFVSLFPENSDDWEKEQLYQIYGKQTQVFGLSHPIFDMYTSQVEIEEV